jgi:hypothetical protein
MCSENSGEGHMDGNSKGWPHIDPFHEFLEEERKRLARRPTRMQKVLFRNTLEIDRVLMEAKRFERLIRLY